jgi:hypothetical protein
MHDSPSVKVVRWLSETKQITYTFGVNNDDIPIVIFRDDTVEKALAKIALGINSKIHQ